MNCTKCGKEIPDGENQVCEDCQKKVLEEIAKEEQNEISNDTSKKEEKISENSSDNSQNQEKKKESKTNKKVNKEKNENAFITMIKKKKKIIGLSIAIIVIISLIIIDVLFFRNNEGNSIGNIRNYGYAATDANWIYYLSPNQKGDEIGIFRAKKDGSKSQQLLMGKMDILSINALDGYLYFIGIGEETFSENDDIDNKIYRLKADGSSEKEVINDNEFHNECYEIYVINQYIYYIGTDQNIYRMTLDGKSRELVSKNGAGYIGITKDYIIYNHEEKIENVEKITEINEEAATTQTNTVTYIMNLDGTNPRPLVKDKRLYSINVNKNYVYYTNTDKQIYRTKIDSNNEELVFDTTAYNLNLKGDYLYYLNYDNVESEDAKVCIYRVKADGSSKEAQKLKTLETYSAFIDIINNRIIYMDANNDYGFINLLKVDGSEEVSLYKLDYNNLENETTETEGNVEEVQESNNSEQVSGSN